MTVDARGRSGYAQANGIRQHYFEYGSGGRTIVVVPGITSPAITWDFVANELAADFRVLTLDIRGRGLTDRPANGYTLPELAADVVAFIRALGLDHPVLLGHSMGARIVAAVGALHPGVAGPLIVVEPPLTGPGRGAYPTSRETFEQQLREAKAGTTVDQMRRLFPGWSERELQIRVEWLATCDEHAVLETYDNFGREDFFPSWRQLPAPVLFVFGGDSPVVTPEGEREVRATNPAAEVVAIGHAGHMVPWDNLLDFVVAVRQWVSRSESLSRRATKP
jgi:N-formylmaleamate deformylase